MAKVSKKAAASTITLSQLRVKLLEQQRALFDEVEGVEAALRVIETDRESELEERSQEEAAAELLARLEEREQAELREIHDALGRIKDGIYGICTQCRGRISFKRLEVIPTAARCARCASKAETEAISSTRPLSSEQAPRTDLPVELRDLDDAEIAALVREHLRDEIGDGLRRLHLSCVGGVIRLGGEVESDELREVVVRIIEDEMGLEVVDRVRVTELAADDEARARTERLPDEIEAAEGALAVHDQVDDVFEAEEEGAGYTPPTRPVPEPK
jgi:DnaK suppressor protein